MYIYIYDMYMYMYIYIWYMYIYIYDICIYIYIWYMYIYMVCLLHCFSWCPMAACGSSRRLGAVPVQHGCRDDVSSLANGVEASFGCGSKWKTDVGPQMWMSSLVLTIQLLGYLILTHTHLSISWTYNLTIDPIQLKSGIISWKNKDG